MPTTSSSERTRQLRLLRGLVSKDEKMGSYKSVYNPGLTLAALPKFFNKLDPGTRRAEPQSSNVPPGPIWLREIGNGSSQVIVFGVTTDPNNGTVLVCGNTNEVLFNGSVGTPYNNTVGFVARYSKSGSFIAGTTIGSGQAIVEADSISTDTHGNIFVAGSTFESLSGDYYEYNASRGFCMKLSSSFDVLNVTEFGSGFQDTYGNTVTVSPDGYVYVGGTTFDTDWYIFSPHASYNNQVGYVILLDISTGEILNGINYGTGNRAVSISKIVYMPTQTFESFPLIAISGTAEEDLDVYNPSQVPGAGEGGSYGFIAFTLYNLLPGLVLGLGSGYHQTSITTMTVTQTQNCGLFLYVGGTSNEYIDPNDVKYGQLLAGGGFQGFICPFFSGPGFYFPSYIGSEQNYTAVTALSSDDLNFYVGGVTSENLNTGDGYSPGNLVSFTLQTSLFNGYTDIRQIGTGGTTDVLFSMGSDTYGNFYAGGFLSEHLPSGILTNRFMGYVAKIADQPKTYNTPIFMFQNPGNNGNLGQFNLEYTAPVTIDWGDGTVQTINSGISDNFSHDYGSNPYNQYLITIDAGSGGSITFLRASGSSVNALDVSRCPTLTYLRCDNNSYLANLNVSGCSNLEYLRCDSDALVSLDVSGLSHLNYLFFVGSNNAISTIHYEGCGLSNVTDITLENSILDLSNNNLSPGRIYMYAKQQDDYFNGNAADYFSGPLPDWTFVILPNPAVTVTADLTGLTFDGSGSLGHNYTHLLTFPSTTTLIVKFSHADASINQVIHLQFQGPDGTLTTSDTYTVQNPTLTPVVSTQDVGGTVYLYTNDSFPLTSSSTITLVTANPITSVTFNMF